MYTKSYPKDNQGILIPEKYGGTAFIDTAIEKKDTYEIDGEKLSEGKTGEAKNPWEENEEKNSTRGEPSAPAGAFGGLFSRLGDGLFGIPYFKSPKAIFSDGLGTEELLIIGLALFLFLSPERDIECALMILLLLFVK